MSKDDLIPVTNINPARPNPMIWEGEEQAQGVFLGGTPDDALALLGVPAMERVRQPRLPEDFEPGDELRRWLANLQDALRRTALGETCDPLPLGRQLDADSLLAIGEILGEGEVSGRMTLDGISWNIQESVLTGVWRVTGDNGEDRVEVGVVPSLVATAAASLQPANYHIPLPAGDVMNAPAVLSEIRDRANSWSGEENHVINFTLLPMSPADHELLIAVLGRADMLLESGGFGDCRVMATTVRHVWAVQYINAMGHTILDTIEVGDVPAAVCAAREDFEDSAVRLGEILEAYLT